MQLNRRYIRGLQFAVAYTFGKTISDGTTFNPPGFNTLRPQALERRPDDVDPAPQPDRQLHLGRAERQPMWNNLLTRGLLDGWQLSGDTAFVSGDWAGVTPGRPRTDNFDFTGGDGGARPNVIGDGLCTSGNCDPTPGGSGSYFNVAAFSRPAGRGDIGNAPVTFYRMPKIVLSNMSIFKNFSWAAASGFSSAGRSTTCSTR